MLFGRRVRFALVILSSQILLIALAITWLAQMILIAANESIQFVEYNRPLLFFEITLSAFICLFALVVFVIQLRRLGERRKNDERDMRGTTGKIS
jgi:membrane protein implicated in regulation of membrane protease activity